MVLSWQVYFAWHTLEMLDLMKLFLVLEGVELFQDFAALIKTSTFIFIFINLLRTIKKSFFNLKYVQINIAYLLRI